MARKISKRAQKVLDSAGHITTTMRELIMFAAQNPGLSSYDYTDDRRYKQDCRTCVMQWNYFAALCKPERLSQITDRALITAANDRLIWDRQLGRWILTDKCDNPALEYRQEAVNLLLRVAKG